MREIEVKKTELIKKLKTNRKNHRDVFLTALKGYREMDVNENVTLDANEFSNYVMDDWSWKEQFNTSNSLYLSKMGM